MASRLSLHNRLVEILGSNKVYFQPPLSRQLEYPCIIYNLADYDKKYASNNGYKYDKSYVVTLIHKNPDNEIKDALIKEPYCSFERFFVSDNLNHYVYRIYY